ncbi:ATP-binding protein [Aliikangiella sp. G2MR2-5]|uniref:ATP-binding protein n=1 Tax=Aliikangiella sp. G2MR2-5 TaxID=2788943 RepID=UPI001AEDB7DA|nr:ATP-binding protein [Aliikangiella sp. G2MR2-5]
MLNLKNSPIKTKIISIALMVSALSIVLVLSIFLYINQQDEKQTTISNISILAKLIGNRSHAALTFNDTSAAENNLMSLASHPLVIRACLYDEKAKLFVSFYQQDVALLKCNEIQNRMLDQSAVESSDNQLTVIEPILIDNEFKGSLEIVANIQVVQEHLFRYLLIAVLVAFAAFILSVLFATRLQTIISNPIVKLAQVTRQVRESYDYSVKAEKMGNDEVGELVDSFNNMLETIGNQNKVLLETTERANQANEVKGQFLANMSHELRTPINGVLGMNDLLMATELTEEQKEYVQLARQSSVVLLDTVNQILDLAAIERVGLRLNKEVVDVENFIKEIGQLFSAQIAAKQLNLTIDIHGEMPTKLEFDPVRLRQVFINLISNAIKFTHVGYISLEVSYQSRRISVTVEDTGVGIPVDAQHRIFESFQQVDNSSTRAYGGTGLGLPISQQICEAMNGCINLVHSSERGSIFEFNVEISPVESQAIVHTKYSSTKVLIIAGEKPIGRWLKRNLAHFGVSSEYYSDDKDLNWRSFQIAIIDFTTHKELFFELKEIFESNNIRVSLLGWVGDDFPSNQIKQSLILYKPLTVFNLKKVVSPSSLVKNFNEAVK